MVGLYIALMIWLSMNTVFLILMMTDRDYNSGRMFSSYVSHYGTLRRGILKELPLGLLLPFPYIALCIKATKYFRKQKKAEQKEELKNANRLYRCTQCDKMIRSYQLDVLEAKEGYSRNRLDCRYCSDGTLRKVIHAQLVDSVLVFLKNHPECPEIDYAGYEKSLELIKSYDLERESKKSKEEIQKILESYQETGNVFFNKLMDKEEK